MIKKITIRDVASYDHEGVVLDDLQKVNFIYGGNGTGKTTISRVLGSENRELVYPNCEVVWDGEPLRVYVYNKDFRERNLRESLPGVFVLGHTGNSIESRSLEGIQPEREAAERQILQADYELNTLMQKRYRTMRDLQEKLWKEVYQPHSGYKQLLKGYHKKASFTERIRKVLEGKRTGDGSWSEVGNYRDIDELHKRYDQLFELKDGINMVYDMNIERALFPREYLEKDFWQYLALKSEGYVEMAEAELAKIDKATRESQRKYNEAVEAYKKVGVSRQLDNKTMFSTVVPSIESINITLKKNGYTGFYLQPSPGKVNEFQIQREDGSYVEDTLSEGEATIISFLYFVQLVEHNERGYDLRSGKVIVFDDPISSLDYDAIELVSSETNRLIFEARKEKKIEKDDDNMSGYYRFNGWIEQVIVLTHNTTFHQVLSVRQPRNNTRYWKLSKKYGVSKVESFGCKNPVNCDYKEMWMMLKEEIEASDSMHLPNTMRRIVETYFVDYGGYDKNALFRGKYCKTKEDRMMVTALMKGADEGSHGAKDNLYSGNREMMCERYLIMFKGLFEAMGQGEHYNMMMAEHHHE